MVHKTEPTTDKPPVEQWLASQGKGSAERICRLLKSFFKFELPIETTVSPFKDATSTFEFSRLFPLAVVCLGFGWIACWICASSDLDVESSSRWAIWPIAFLAIYGAIRAIKHFIRPRRIEWWPSALICLFTATIGLLSLLLFKNLAEWMADINVNRGFPALIKTIGKCYRAAFDAEAELSEKFLGFIGGVGLCEESVKILPVCLLMINRKRLPFKLELSFRSFLMLAFFSGLGFGIGEALCWYAIPDDAKLASQLTRWFACVPSHAIYTMIDAAFLWMLVPRLQKAVDPRAKVGWFALCVAVVAVLHGIYDVLCELPFVGLLMDAASLLLLWWAVRFAIRHRSSVSGSEESGLGDFNAATFSTFGKSFAKTYLIIVIGIVIYAKFWCY